MPGGWLLTWGLDKSFQIFQLTWRTNKEIIHTTDVKGKVFRGEVEWRMNSESDSRYPCIKIRSLSQLGVVVGGTVHDVRSCTGFTTHHVTTWTDGHNAETRH